MSKISKRWSVINFPEISNWWRHPRKQTKWLRRAIISPKEICTTTLPSMMEWTWTSGSAKSYMGRTTHRKPIRLYWSTSLKKHIAICSIDICAMRRRSTGLLGGTPTSKTPTTGKRMMRRPKSHSKLVSWSTLLMSQRLIDKSTGAVVDRTLNSTYKPSTKLIKDKLVVFLSWLIRLDTRKRLRLVVWKLFLVSSWTIHYRFTNAMNSFWFMRLLGTSVTLST